MLVYDQEHKSGTANEKRCMGPGAAEGLGVALSKHGGLLCKPHGLGTIR